MRSSGEFFWFGIVLRQKRTTVYTADYVPANGALSVKNHKWVVESDCQPNPRNKY